MFFKLKYLFLFSSVFLTCFNESIKLRFKNHKDVEHECREDWNKCPDSSSCCPQDMKCSSNGCLPKGELKVKNHSFKEVLIQAPIKTICLDPYFSCPDESTCCLSASHEYDCCPYREAVCCDDMIHCCPSDTLCDPEGKFCISNSSLLLLSFPSSSLTPNLLSLHRFIPKLYSQCENSEFTCPSNSTCCPGPFYGYTCCPYQNGVCCEDNLHCCPRGTTCDVSHKRCSSSFSDDRVIRWEKKVPAFKDGIFKKIICPDPLFVCPDDTTCCYDNNFGYGCCPFSQAVCCTDGKHCCPENTICDLETQTCLRKNFISSFSNLEHIPWKKKFPAFQEEKKKKPTTPDYYVCPKQTYMCPLTYPCCQLPSGQEGCCQFSYGVCCNDSLHCCPQNYKCDPDNKRCLHKDSIVTLHTNLLPSPVPKKDDFVPMLRFNKNIYIKCGPEGKCYASDTCCSIKNDSKYTYSCCPVPNGSCCLKGGCCRSYCIPFLNKCLFGLHNKKDAPLNISDLKKTNKVEKVVWCDKNKEYYCSEGYQCNFKDKKCFLSSSLSPHISFSSFLNTFPQLKASKLKNICRDESIVCLKDHTCCHKENGGSEGCCPFKNGKCCAGGEMCCPEDTICDETSKRCKSSTAEIYINMFSLKPPHDSQFKKELVVDSNEICPDKAECPSETTCCQLVNKQYSCCQYPKAVCCQDKIHCCPQGYRCNLDKKLCEEETGNSFISWKMHTRKKAKIMKNLEIKEEEQLCRKNSNSIFTHRCPLNYTCCYAKEDKDPSCCDKDSICCHGKCCPKKNKCSENGACVGRV